MIGQKKLTQLINSLDRLPNSILLVGEKGSEQEDICDYISNKFDLLEFDMTQLINDEFIAQIYESHSPTLYVINLNEISEREQNILLKLFEEPTPYSYILLLAESDALVLDTIKSRSFLLKTDVYLKDELKPLIVDRDEDLVLSICSTPGQIELANHTDMNNLLVLCEKMIDSMKVANYANALSIVNKINFKDSYEKFDLYLFIKMLRNLILKNKDNNLYMYNELLLMSKNIFSMNDKRLAFENFITKVWKSSRLV